MQLARLMARNGLTAEQASGRLAAQMDIEEKRRRADYVIDNSGAPAETEQQVAALLDRLGLS
ncbi:Dephospho-CoA kinase [compost metagenome]